MLGALIRTLDALEARGQMDAELRSNDERSPCSSIRIFRCSWVHRLGARCDAWRGVGLGLVGPMRLRGSDAGCSAATVVRDAADGYCDSVLGETTGCFSGPVVFESAEAALGAFPHRLGRMLGRLVFCGQG